MTIEYPQMLKRRMIVHAHHEIAIIGITKSYIRDFLRTTIPLVDQTPLCVTLYLHQKDQNSRNDL